MNGDVGTNAQNTAAITIAEDAVVNGDAGTGPGGTVDITGSAVFNGEISDTVEEVLDPVVIPVSLTSLGSSGNLKMNASNPLVTLSTGEYKYCE